MAITQRGSVLVPADAAAFDWFGHAVALNATADTLVVGAPERQSGGISVGGVYIYDRSGSSWTARGSVRLAADVGAGDEYGLAVALSGDGNVLAIGSPGWESGAGAPNGRGAVYIYDRSGSSWTARGSVLLASDGTSPDFFGGALALNSDGSVLAVGAEQWEGSLTDQGGVYLYDWSGSAWVQRGSVLTASDAAASDHFGSSLALSGDGTILAVGARDWEGANSNQGGVYLYDWSGSAWVQRGSVLTASDAAASDGFGASVALSTDGLVLAVGARTWEGAAADQGGVYIYDWSGSAWVQRGSVLEAGDAEASDNFGSGVALSGDGNELAVGARGWDGTGSAQGGVYIFDLIDVVVDVICPTALTVVYPSLGPIECPTRLNVQGAAASIEAPTLLAVIDSSPATLWTARCTLDGVDVSARLTGNARVTIEEGAARLAVLTLTVPSGSVAPLDYVGKDIALDFSPVISGTPVPIRMFTGRVDTPEYDPIARLLVLNCVDDLQNRVAALDRAALDLLIGGRYSAAVQGDADDNWDYAQARLTTVQASLDAGAAGGLRLTAWQDTAVWRTFTSADLLWPHASVSYPQRSSLVNEVTCEFDYRYPRLRQRYTTLGWSGTHIDMAPNGYQYPTQQDILGAAGGSGWTVTGASFWPAPAAIPHSSGGFIYTEDGAIDMAILHLAQRHSQTVTERYTLTVRAPESVSANGTLPGALRGALESEFDGGAWESALDVAPLMPTGGEQDYAPDAPRADADYAIQTLLDQAAAKIIGSHRSARVGSAVPCLPDLDVDKRVAINTGEIIATGKVVRVEHVLDFMAGSATSEFEIACSGASGTGIVTPTPLTPPAAPSAADESQDWPSQIPPLFVNTFGITPYADNLMGLILNPPESIFVEDIPAIGSKSFPNPYYVAGTYPVSGFRVRMPGVDDADRNQAEKTSTGSYDVEIPIDPLTFIVP